MANQLIASPRLNIMGIATQSTEVGVNLATNVNEYGLTKFFESSVTNPMYFETAQSPALPAQRNSFIGLAGLQPESAHRNLLSESRDFDTLWDLFAGIASSLDLSAIVDPFNGSDSWRVGTADEVQALAHKYLWLVISNRPAESVQYTLSAYLRQSPSNARMAIGNSTNDAYARYDMTGAGAILSSGTSGSGYTMDGNSITRIGTTDWYFCTVTVTTSATASQEARIGYLDEDDNDDTQQSDYLTAGIGVHSAQVELGDTATSPHHRVASILGEVPGATWRPVFSTDDDDILGVRDYDPGIIHVAQDSYDFRGWEHVHTHHLITDDTGYPYLRVELYDEDSATAKIARVILDDAWVGPLVPMGDVHVLSFSEEQRIQRSSGNIPRADQRPRKRSASYPIQVLNQSDAFNRYVWLSRYSNREVYLVLNTTTTTRSQRDSVFALANWQELIQDNLMFKGGIQLVEMGNG